LNRHDAKVAKGAMFRTLDRRTRKPVYGAFSPDPRKTLNRHDAKAAMDGMFGTFQSRTREPVLEAFRSSVPLPPLSHFGLGVPGTQRQRWVSLAVNNFGLGLEVPFLSPHSFCKVQ
jgi:hypothetical protein